MSSIAAVVGRILLAVIFLVSGATKLLNVAGGGPSGRDGSRLAAAMVLKRHLPRR